MKKNEKICTSYGLIVLLLLFLGSCKSVTSSLNQKHQKVNRLNTPQTTELLQRINDLGAKGYAFGHQDTAAYGIGWKNDGNSYKSDVHEITGDYPAVYGFEIGHIELDREQSLDTVSFRLITKLIQKAHRDGGIVTVSWHPNNPRSNRSTWNTRKTVKHILSDGRLHKKYKLWLSRVATFFKGLKADDGSAIPVVFRPYHEMNGGWFWWGKGHCTPEEYIKLWQETIAILSNDFEVHNLLYAYSPNTVKNSENYLKYYPGDAYVDILGVDIYQHWTAASFAKNLKNNMKILKDIAQAKQKPYALTEAGLNKVSIPTWWTQILDENIKDSGIAWALFWRNARLSHFYVPYPGQASSEDFMRFKALPHVLFLNDIK